ncbi:hypothetical protein evm_009346 [Chilo suppressalis]|nr:hypothetical protein evm_009346 [Chilo suppressalis]
MKRTMSYHNTDLDIIEGGSHDLLDPPAPAYSNLTVRRAFIVWLYCGQLNKFRDVLNYYHRLECLEETMSRENRVASLHHELELFVNGPPTSRYLRRNYPELYNNRPVEPQYVDKIESIKNEKCIFKLEGFHTYKLTGVSSNEIIEASRIIRHYCQTHFLTLKNFREEFHQYATKCNIKESVSNITAYIKRKHVEAELVTIEKIPKDLKVFNISFDSVESDVLADERPLESQKLKMLLGVSAKSSDVEDSNDNTSSKDKSISCAEFFKLFKSNQQIPDVKYVAYSNSNVYPPPTFEDFAKALDMNHVKSRPGDGVNISVLANKSFKRNQDIMYDSHVKKFNLTKAREI